MTLAAALALQSASFAAPLRQDVIRWGVYAGPEPSTPWVSSAGASCFLSWQYYADPNPILGTKYGQKGVAGCDWETIPAVPGPTVIFADCGYYENNEFVSLGFLGNFKGENCDLSVNTDRSPGLCRPDRIGTPNPVILSSGAKYRDDVDFVTADGLMRVKRHYRSNQFSDMPYAGVAYGPNIGAGWSFENQWRIGLTDDFAGFNAGVFIIRKGDGGEYKYQLNANGSIVPAISENYGDRDFAISLVSPTNFSGNYQGIINSGARFRIRDNDGTVVLMDLFAKDGTFKFGRIHSVQTPEGYLQTYAYSVESRISTITDSFSRTLTFNWAERSVAGSEGPAVQSVDITSIGLPDGNRVEYVYDTVNGTAALPGTSRLKTVTIKSAANVTLDSTTYHYENADYVYALTGVTDNRGVRFRTSTYDVSGRVSMSEGPAGIDRLTFVYDQVTLNNQLYFRATTTNVKGKTTRYLFRYLSDPAYPHSKVFERLEGDVSANCPATVGTFEWQFIGNREYVSSWTDAEGRVTSYLRDGFGRATSVTEGTGPAQRVTTMTWSDVNNQPLIVTEPGRRTQFNYGTTGRLTSVTQTDLTTSTVPYSTNGQQRTWTYTYGAGGRVTAVDGPLAGTGDRVLYAYAANGNLTSTTNEVGHITTINASNSRGQPTRSTDPNGVVTNYTYDGLGRLASMVNSVGATPTTTSFTYDAVGLIKRITVPGGVYLDHTYDAARRLITVTNSSNESITYTRDAMGQITRTQVRAGTVVKAQRDNVYDELGRLMRTVGASSAKNWKVGYDKTDNIISVTDPRSKIWSYGFDSLNRLISETEPGTGTVTMGLNGIDAVTSYKDRRNLTTSYVRNGFGDVIRQTNPDTGITDYIYDARGLLIQIKDARNVITNMTYDAAGRMLTRTYPAATAENVTFTYDSVANGNKGKGLLTRLADQAGASVFVYDVRGNLLSETRTIGTVAYAVRYTYDAADRLTSMTYPSGRIVTYVRNAQGKITGVTSKANATAAALTLASNVVWQPNVAGAVAGETVFGQGSIATAVQSMALPGDGGLGQVDLLQSLTYGNGLVLWKNFSTDNELYQLIVEQTPSTPAGIRVNRFQNRADNTFITGIVDGVTAANSETFTYTDAGRLSGATSGAGSYGTRAWTYDNNGNRLSQTANGVANTYTYPANNNRLTNVKQGTTTTRAFLYDAAGHMTRDTRGATQYNTAINNAGRIRTLSIGTTLKTTYTYDGLQRLRVRTQASPASTTHLVWNAFGTIIAEHAAAGAVQKEYIWLGDTPLAVFEGASLYYVHPDHLDRPVMMTNANAGQTIAWQANYDPFGNAVTVTAAPVNNQRLPGQWFQLEDGLSYNWHRTYDPTIGRYTQPDPLGFVDGPSIYAYAGGNPLVFNDFTGLDTPAMGPYGPCYSGVCGGAYKLLKSPKYDFLDCNSEARGRIRSFTCGAPSLKCNKFVWDAASGANKSPGRMPDGRIPSASEWGNRSTPIGGYYPLPSGEQPQPGDIVGDGQHVGIFSPLTGQNGPNGSPGTISSRSSLPFGGDSVVHNDWGFRPGQSPVIWRPIN
ncbi:MAG: hypothetical protein HC788_05760 [Sphingopyxis sp.]|nr:hypothetical protein [Sphingopyxis sp.]